MPFLMPPTFSYLNDRLPKAVLHWFYPLIPCTSTVYMYLSLKNRMNKKQLVTRNTILAYIVCCQVFGLSPLSNSKQFIWRCCLFCLLINVNAGISPDSVDEVLAIGAVWTGSAMFVKKASEAFQQMTCPLFCIWHFEVLLISFLYVDMAS